MDELKARFLRDAPTQWAAYDRRAVLLKATVTMVQDGVTVTDEFIANESCRMVIRKHRNSQESDLYAVNPDYAFHLKRRTDFAPWILVDVGVTKRDDELPRLARMLARDTNWPHSVLTRLYGEKLADLVALPEFKIKSLKAESDQSNLVTLEFECLRPIPKDRKPAYAVQGGSVVLDSASYWTLREGRVHIRSARGTGAQSFKTTMAESAEISLPMQIRASETWILEDGTKYEPKTETDVSFDFSARVPDPSHFRLSAFGIPEPPDLAAPTDNGFTILFWLMNVAGLALIVLGVLYSRRQRRAGLSPK